jgi:uncharacterized membrane protein
MFRLSFYPVFDSYPLVAVVALLLLAAMWFGPSKRKIVGWRRWVLIVPRLLVILLVLAAMLRPTLIYTETTKQAATLVVLADQSRSMSVPDMVNNKTRWNMLREVVSDASPALAKLQKDFELKAYTFDDEVHAVAAERGKIELPEQPEGQQTAIGAALEDVLQREASKRLLGVVLLSDGAQRAYPPRDLPAQTAASRMKHLGHRLYTVPFGQSRGLGEAKDVAIKDLTVSPTVFVKNELAIHGQVQVDGYVNCNIPVRVLFETSPGKMEPVAHETLHPTTNGQLLPVSLTYTPEVPGEYKLTLEVENQDGELVTTNNQLSAFVRVLRGGLRVLYIEGEFRREAGAIRRALGSSPDVKIDYIGPSDLASRSESWDERFQPGKYDVYILGDIDSAMFRGNELRNLARCVERGAGLLMLGGLHSFGAGGYGDTPLANVLPIGMNPGERQRFDEPLRTDLHSPGPLPMKPTPAGLVHFIMMLVGNRQENEVLWTKLPPLNGANKFHDIAPGANILADAGEQTPLLVAHGYEAGRVIAFAGDSTWRWILHGYESAHKRFWRQLILWLARKDQNQEGNITIQLQEGRFAPSQRVEFTVVATSAMGEPIPDATYEAQIVLPDGTKRPLSLVRHENQMAGSFRDTQTAGDYAIEVTAKEKDQPLGSARARFLVSRQDLELDNAAADAAVLESLAAMTGGESIEPERLPDLIQRLTADTQHLEVEQETKKTFWDTWGFFLTLVGFLGLEWYLRKRWGLV